MSPSAPHSAMTCGGSPPSFVAAEGFGRRCGLRAVGARCWRRSPGALLGGHARHEQNAGWGRDRVGGKKRQDRGSVEADDGTPRRDGGRVRTTFANSAGAKMARCPRPLATARRSLARERSETVQKNRSVAKKTHSILKSRRFDDHGLRKHPSGDTMARKVTDRAGAGSKKHRWGR